MSDVGREWRFCIDDMIAFAGKVLAYTAGLDQAAFVANALVYDATLRNLELIGEAATHVPDAVRQAHPQVPWRNPQVAQRRGCRKRAEDRWEGGCATRCGDLAATGQHLPALRHR